MAQLRSAALTLQIHVPAIKSDAFAKSRAGKDFAERFS
jgi:hypothetical protein